MPDTEMVQRLDEILGDLSALEGALLPILHEVQASFGYVPTDTLPRIAERLNISRAEVYGVVSFYHDFRTGPAGRHILKFCRSEACKARGADAMADRLRQKLGIDWHGTTPDGGLTLEPVYCLGLCASGPCALIGDRLVARLDDARLDTLVAETRA